MGAKVTKFKVGDQVGVGCKVSSCMKCKDCKAGEEQMCNDQIGTYNHPKQLERSATYPEKSRTFGGYTNIHIVHEHFAIKIPSTYPFESAGSVSNNSLPPGPIIISNILISNKLGLYSYCTR